jgi:hypothetical protein
MNMKNALLAMAAAMCIHVAGALAQTAPSAATLPMTLHQKFQIYLRQTYSVSGMAVRAGLAAIDQAGDTPEEWSQSGQGYPNRLGTRRGQVQIGNLCALSVDAALHEDPRFRPSGLHGMWQRTKYVALSSPAPTAEERNQPSATMLGP